jgi:hypothetical protein
LQQPEGVSLFLGFWGKKSQEQTEENVSNGYGGMATEEMLGRYVSTEPHA